jgi:hypothetical protein
VVPALLLVGPLPGAPKKEDKDLDKNSEKTVQAGQVTGKVMNVYEDKKKIRLQVTYMNPKLDQGAANALAQAQIQFQQALARRPIDYNAVRTAQQQMALNQAKLITYEKKTQDYEIQANDDVVVRSANPPEQFDEKGKVKKYTKKELDELRGPDHKVPGFKAEFGDIQTDMLVKVQLVRKKDAPKPVVRKPKDKDAELDVMGDYEPHASMIIILFNPAAMPPGAK